MPFTFVYLQVPSSASKSEVNLAFRGLVRKLHPDVNSSSQATRLLQVLIHLGLDMLLSEESLKMLVVSPPLSRSFQRLHT